MASITTTGVVAGRDQSLSRRRAPAPAVTSPAERFARRSAPRTTTAWACLLLASDASRLDRFRDAATEAGWNPIACGAIDDATREFQRWRTQLAVIDLGAMPEVQKVAYLQFAARIASRERLLLVCDESGEGPGEIAARQAGAWLYVPSPDLDGSPDFDGGVVELFREAMNAAEKAGVAPTNAPPNDVTANES